MSFECVCWRVTKEHAGFKNKLAKIVRRMYAHLRQGCSSDIVRYAQLAAKDWIGKTWPEPYEQVQTNRLKGGLQLSCRVFQLHEGGTSVELQRCSESIL
jgi:hypothetical protein